MLFRYVSPCFRLNRLGLGILDHETSDKELAKEVQVAAVHEKSRNDGTVVDRTFLFRLVELVGQNGHGTASNHLCYLHKGDPHGIEPLGLHFHGHQKVVAVHDGVDGVVHGGHVDANGRGVGVSVPRVEEDGDVMVPVQKQNVLLVNHQEKRIDQFTANNNNKNMM